MTEEEFAKTLPYMSVEEFMRATRSLSEIEFERIIRHLRKVGATPEPATPSESGEGTA